MLTLGGTFSVIPIYHRIAPASTIDIAATNIWETTPPLKAKVVAWLVLYGQLLALEEIIRRNIVVAFDCVLYNAFHVTTNHLFLHCPYTRCDSLFSLLTSTVFPLPSVPMAPMTSATYLSPYLHGTLQLLRLCATFG